MPAKRILILTNRVPHPLNDGGNLAMHAMIEGYRRQGWQVFLLSMNTSRHYITADVLKTIYTSIAGFETVDIDNAIKPVPTLINYLFSSQPNHAARFFQQAFAAKLKAAIRSFAPHAIQFESVFLTGYLPLVRKHTNAITILRLHNIEYQVWKRLAGETQAFFKKAYLKNLAERIEKYEPAAWAQYDLLLPITHTDAAVVRSSGTQTEMLPMPFGIDNTNSIAGSNSQWACYHIGAMDWLPNQEAMKWFLLEIWPLVHQKLPEFPFYYAGRNMPAYFSALHTPGAHCMGEVPDAGAFIAEKKILIVPLRSGGGIRVKVLEAMAAGKIIISTSIGMQGIDAEKDVHYLQADNTAAFVDKLNWILTHKEEAEAIGKEAKILAADKYDNRQLMQALDNKLHIMLHNVI